MDVDPLLFSESGVGAVNTSWSDVELGMFPMTGRGGLRRSVRLGVRLRGTPDNPDEVRPTTITTTRLHGASTTSSGRMVRANKASQ